MVILPEVVRQSEERAEALPPRLVDEWKIGVPLEAEAQLDPTRIQQRRSFLSEGGANPSATEYERLLGTNDLVDEFYLERALVSAQPVCRIAIRSRSGRELGCATGVMVSPRLLLTNWHVFPTDEQALHGIAEFNFRDDIRGNPMTSFRFNVRPDLFYFSNRELDFAVVSVEGESAEGSKTLEQFGYHRLFLETGKIQPREWMTIIQHPGGRRRQHAIRENQLIEVQPDHLWYMSDTAQGSSGAPVFNDSFQIVALHHSGKARQEGGMYVLRSGRRVATLDNVDETDVDWVANEGVRISRVTGTLFGEAREKGEHLSELRAAMEGGDVLTRNYRDFFGGEAVATTDGTVQPATRMNASTIPIHLDLRVTVNGQAIGGAAPAPAKPAAPEMPEARPTEASELEKMPIIDSEYENRKGFDEMFLGVKTALPRISDEKAVSRMDDDSYYLPYQHFSIVIHKKRRLALFTASNVDGRKKSKAPEPGNYSRKGLGGFRKNDREDWVTDPRIPEQHQLPDKFYKTDRNSFDRGHIVRREDVCWGSSYAEVQRANGDSYHTTNCSPQVADFNQASMDGVWGELEDEILKQAGKEKYCLFAGPIFDEENDPEFEGVDKHGRIRVKIPQSFWKMVVAVKGGKLKAYAFVLSQDLSSVRFEEFAVKAQWRPFQVSIKSLEKDLKVVRFDEAIHKADQFPKNGNNGEERLEVKRGTQPVASGKELGI